MCLFFVIVLVISKLSIICVHVHIGSAPQIANTSNIASLYYAYDVFCKDSCLDFFVLLRGA